MNSYQRILNTAVISSLLLLPFSVPLVYAEYQHGPKDKAQWEEKTSQMYEKLGVSQEQQENDLIGTTKNDSKYFISLVIKMFSILV